MPTVRQKSRRHSDDFKREAVRTALERKESDPPRSIGEIATSLNVARSMLQKWMDDPRYNTPAPTPSNGKVRGRYDADFRAKVVREAIKQRAQGIPWDKIGRPFGVTGGSVQKWVERANGHTLGLPMVAKHSKPRALIPTTFACPHCGNPVTFANGVTP